MPLLPRMYESRIRTTGQPKEQPDSRSVFAAINMGYLSFSLFCFSSFFCAFSPPQPNQKGLKKTALAVLSPRLTKEGRERRLFSLFFRRGSIHGSLLPG